MQRHPDMAGKSGEEFGCLNDYPESLITCKGQNSFQVVRKMKADESIMEVLALTLQMEGYQVVCSAQCGEEILPRIARVGTALVILDFKISGEVSILTCGLIKQRWPSLPVIGH